MVGCFVFQIFRQALYIEIQLKHHYTLVELALPIVS